MGCHHIDEYNNRCDFRYELKYLWFRDPISKQSNEISICPRHFGETIEEPLVLPLQKLFHKRDNLFAKQKREIAIAKREAISKKNHMAQIVHFHEIGGADVLKIEELPLTEPIEGEVVSN